MRQELVGAILAVIIAGAALFNYSPSIDASALQQFEEFKSSYGRSYEIEENVYRFSIFMKNLDKIAKHNSDQSQTYTMGVTQFADLTTQEFVAKILMKDLGDQINNNGIRLQSSGLKTPQSIDWRSNGALNEVKNQGRCGSCWAFSTTGTLQSHVKILKGTLQSFSEQQLVDCCGSKGFQCQGCSGAWPEWALNYINNAGIVHEADYAYTGVQGGCKSLQSPKKLLNSAKPWTMLAVDAKALKETVGNTGPVSVCLDASNWSLYKSGIFTNCGTTNLNHAVVAIGYTSENVWLIRNSWGTTWGEQGHIRLGPGNTCGLLNHALIPNLA